MFLEVNVFVYHLVQLIHNTQKFVFQLYQNPSKWFNFFKKSLSFSIGKALNVRKKIYILRWQLGIG